jgi:hypothetical protein
MSQEQEVKPATETKAKKEAATSADWLQNTALEVEQLTKTKALNMAEKLADSIESDYFKLGGVLKVIFDNAWFEGYESFDLFVYERYGFQGRKARYLMEIYTELVGKQIPWEKVQGLGWTKLKELARHLTVDNVDSWVEKASNCTVVELQAMLKATLDKGEGGEASTKDDITKITFKLHNDQSEIVTTALNKAKAECSTEYDNVALEMICAGYVGGNSALAKAESSGDAVTDLKSLMGTLGWEGALTAFSELFPEVDLEVKV